MIMGIIELQPVGLSGDMSSLNNINKEKSFCYATRNLEQYLSMLSNYWKLIRTVKIRSISRIYIFSTQNLSMSCFLRKMFPNMHSLAQEKDEICKSRHS